MQEQVTHGHCGISSHGDTRNPSGHGVGQPAAAGGAGGWMGWFFAGACQSQLCREYIWVL